MPSREVLDGTHVPSIADSAFCSLIEALSDKDETQYRSALEVLTTNSMPTYDPPGEPRLKEWLAEIAGIAVSSEAKRRMKADPTGPIARICDVLVRAGNLLPVYRLADPPPTD